MRETDEKGRIDVTNSVYIHKTIEDLREAVEKYNIQKNWLKCVYYPYITCILLLKLAVFF